MQRVIKLTNKPCLDSILSNIKKEYKSSFLIKIQKQNKNYEVIKFCNYKYDCKLLEKWKLSVLSIENSITISIYENLDKFFLIKIRHGFFQKKLEPFLENFFEVFFVLQGEKHKKFMYYCDEKETIDIFGDEN